MRFDHINFNNYISTTIHVFQTSLFDCVALGVILRLIEPCVDVVQLPVQIVKIDK